MMQICWTGKYQFGSETTKSDANLVKCKISISFQPYWTGKIFLRWFFISFELEVTIPFFCNPKRNRFKPDKHRLILQATCVQCLQTNTLSWDFKMHKHNFFLFLFLSFFLSVCENKYYSWSCFTFGIEQTLWKFIQKKNGEAVKQKTCLICGKNKHLNSLLWKVGKINSLFHISVIRSSRDGCFDIMLVHISQFRFASKVNNNDNLQTKPEVASRFSI